MVLYSDCTNLHSHQQCTKFPHSRQYLLFLVFLIIGILTGLRWYLIVVLICISLMINDVEHLFIYLLANFMFLWENFIKIFCPFLIRFFCYFVWTLFFWILALITIWFAIIFCHPVGFLFSRLQILVVWCSSTYLFLLLLLVVRFKNHCKDWCQGIYCYVFF